MTSIHLTDQSLTGATTGHVREADNQTRTISDAVETIGFVRNQTKILADDSFLLHHSLDKIRTEALDMQLERMANQRAKSNLTDLLEELKNLGLSWRAIARIAQVSVPALRKWRLGAAATGENRKRVATLVALCDIAREQYSIEDVAGWLETPLYSKAPITGLDLIEKSRLDLVLSLACDYNDGVEAVLDEFDPEWKQRYASKVEVFTAPDGLPGLQIVGRKG